MAEEEARIKGRMGMRLWKIRVCSWQRLWDQICIFSGKAAEDALSRRRPGVFPLGTKVSRGMGQVRHGLAVGMKSERDEELFFAINK